MSRTLKRAAVLARLGVAAGEHPMLALQEAYRAVLTRAAARRAAGAARAAAARLFVDHDLDQGRVA